MVVWLKTAKQKPEAADFVDTPAPDPLEVRKLYWALLNNCGAGAKDFRTCAKNSSFSDLIDIKNRLASYLYYMDRYFP